MRLAKDDAAMQTENKGISTRVLEDGTKVNISFGDVVVPATLNDSKAAKALIDMLPYTVSVNQYQFDVCGVMPDKLPYDEVDIHNGWLNGDINYALDGNWFTILYGNEENSSSHRNQINIGIVNCELSVLEELSGSYEVTIELAE